MARTFFYSIIVSHFRPEDIDKIEEVFMAYGLHPDLFENKIDAFETIPIADRGTARAFNEEFCDAVWDALGTYVHIHMASTCLDQFEHEQTFDRSAYAEWAIERNTE